MSRSLMAALVFLTTALMACEGRKGGDSAHAPTPASSRPGVASTAPADVSEPTAAPEMSTPRTESAGPVAPATGSAESTSEVRAAATPTPDAVPTATPRPTVAKPDPPLLDTPWDLVLLRGEPVTAGASGKIPFVLLLPGEHRLVGHGGINNFSGAFELNGNSLVFGQTLSTMMAGSPAMMQQETAFLTALGTTTSWRIAEGRLELFDSGGDVLAVFEPGAVE